MPIPAEDLAYRGDPVSVAFAYDASGARRAKEFLDALSLQERAAFDAVFEAVCKYRIHNKQRFRRLDDRISEFKIGGFRIAAFFHNGSWLLTHGFPKLKEKQLRREIRKAHEIRAAHLATHPTTTLTSDRRTT